MKNYFGQYKCFPVDESLNQYEIHVPSNISVYKLIQDLQDDNIQLLRVIFGSEPILHIQLTDSQLMILKNLLNSAFKTGDIFFKAVFPNKQDEAVIDLYTIVHVDIDGFDTFYRLLSFRTNEVSCVSSKKLNQVFFKTAVDALNFEIQKRLDMIIKEQMELKRVISTGTQSLTDITKDYEDLLADRKHSEEIEFLIETI